MRGELKSFAGFFWMSLLNVPTKAGYPSLMNDRGDFWSFTRFFWNSF
jgi:hypothetical protein